MLGYISRIWRIFLPIPLKGRCCLETWRWRLLLSWCMFVPVFWLFFVWSICSRIEEKDLVWRNLVEYDRNGMGWGILLLIWYISPPSIRCCGVDCLHLGLLWGLYIGSWYRWGIDRDFLCWISLFLFWGRLEFLESSFFLLYWVRVDVGVKG